MRKMVKVCCVLVLVAGSVFALEIDNNTVAQREELLFREIPVVFAAARREQKITEAPSAVTIITRQEIEDFGYHTLGEALRGALGLYTYYDREYINLGTRGFARPGDYGTRILLMVDGHYYNDNIYGSSYFGHDFGIDMDLVKRIEVVRGPGSALYGTYAFFAVINVVTISGADVDGFLPSGNYGTNAATKGEFIWGKELDNGLNLLAEGSTSNSDGYKSLYFAAFDDPSTNNGIAENSDYQKYYNLFTKVNRGSLTLIANSNSREKGFSTAAYETVFNDPRASDIDKRSFVDLKYEPKLAADKSALFRLYYDNYQYTGNYPYDYPPVTMNRDYSEGNWWGAETQFSWDILPSNKLIAGGEYQNHTKVLMQNFDVDDPDNPYFSSNQPFSIWSFYLQDEIKTEVMGLTLGVRNDNYPAFGNVVNPRIGAVFNPLDNTFIKLLYGQAFRAPTPYEKYYNDGDVTSKANLNLNPETINTYEIVLEQGSPADMHYRLSLYRSNIDNLITQQTDPSDGLLQFQNVDKVKSTGLEFSSRKSFGNSYGYIGYTYNRAIDGTTGQQLTNSPENSASAGYVHAFPGRKISLATELIYLGQRKTLAGNYTSPYLLTNLNLRIAALFNSEVSLKINNLFDVQYADPASGEHVMDTIAQDGRAYVVKVTIPIR